MAARLAVIGAGWAGLAAAVTAVDAGWQVTVFELARQVGGRARSLPGADPALDNGQHIMIGAYVRTLELMARVGVDTDRTLARSPLSLLYPDGTGLQLRAGRPAAAIAGAVLRARGWSWRDRLSFLSHAARWAAAGFRCDRSLTVGELCASLPATVRSALIEPLCVAALNTPATIASASVFLRVLRDALFAAPGSADLLLPRRPLSELLPEPAAAWLLHRGAQLRLGMRVQSLRSDGGSWQVDDQPFDAAVIACPANEAARLARGSFPAWAERAAALPYEPIVTVYFECEGARLAAPMTALACSPTQPAQFVFDHGALGLAEGRFACVASGAGAWVELGLEATAASASEQLLSAFPAGTWPAAPKLLKAVAERRATFRCTPGLERPQAAIAPNLVAAGDYVEGPYPATLEGAVRSGEAAVALLGRAGRAGAK
jgi:squalene-associated FAD-dependent desaturase